MEYLDFELPIKELEDQLDKCQVLVANLVTIFEILELQIYYNKL